MGVLRLFLSLSVLLGHTRGHGFLGLSFVFPEIAVQSFFIISGFYMALVLNEKYNQPGQYLTFITQRFLRLYPSYLVLILTVVAIDLTVHALSYDWWGSLRNHSATHAVTGYWWGSLGNYADNWHLFSPLGLAILIFENLVIFGQDILMMGNLDPTTGHLIFFWHQGTVTPVSLSRFLLIGSSWSLAVEFSFYMLAPFLVRRPLRAQLIIFALGFGVRAAMFLLIPDDPHHWIYFLFPANLFFFMAGSLGYIIYKTYPAQLRALGTKHWWLIVLFAIVGLDYNRYPLNDELFLLWIPMVFFMVPLLFTLTCRNRTDRLIGELSYPCYLIHPHVLKATIPFFSVHGAQWALGPVSIAISVSLSYLFYRFFEVKTERFRESIYQKSRPKSAGPEPDKETGFQTTAPKPT